jgi:hypothetical protein
MPLVGRCIAQAFATWPTDLRPRVLFEGILLVFGVLARYKSRSTYDAAGSEVNGQQEKNTIQRKKGPGGSKKAELARAGRRASGLNVIIGGHRRREL